MLECKESEIFKYRRDISDEKTEEGKDRSHLSMPSDQLSFCSF